jgi:hypothetical protein
MVEKNQEKDEILLSELEMQELGLGRDIRMIDADTFIESEAEEQASLINRAFEDAAQAVRDGRAAPGILDRLADIRAIGFIGAAGAVAANTFINIWKSVRPAAGGLDAIGGLKPDKPEFEPDKPDKPDQSDKPTRKPRKQVFDIPPTAAPFIPVGVRGTTTEFVKGEEKQVPAEDIDTPQGSGLLRPEFMQLGTDYFDKLYNTPITVQNSEWVEFNYVPVIDKKNGIQIDNVLGYNIRFSKPLYLPKYTPKPAPPSKLSVRLKEIPMRDSVQIFQRFYPKFDKADMGRQTRFTPYYNMSVFDSNFKNLKLYNPNPN